MSLYSLNVSAVGKTQKKSSAVEAAAYQARESIYDRVTGETYSTSENRHGKVLYKYLLAPEGAPSWTKDRKEIWTQAEEIETKGNARFAKSFIVGLQNELSLKENILLLARFVGKEFTSKGLAVDVAIHAPSKDGDQRNTHAHLLVSTRTINTPLGFGGKCREIEGPKALKAIRESWADEINLAFERNGRPERVSHKSLANQGIVRTPQQHQGQAATAIERKGGIPGRTKFKQHPFGEFDGVTATNLYNSFSPEVLKENGFPVLPTLPAKEIHIPHLPTVKPSPPKPVEKEEKEKLIINKFFKHIKNFVEKEVQKMNSMKQIAEGLFTSFAKERDLYADVLNSNTKSKTETEFLNGSKEELSEVCKKIKDFFSNGETTKNYQKKFTDFQGEYKEKEATLYKSESSFFNDGRYEAVKSIHVGFFNAVKQMNLLKKEQDKKRTPPQQGLFEGHGGR